MTYSRRDFLKTSMIAGAGIMFPSLSSANTPWATLPASVGDMPKYKVLEIFLPGGLSQWENFWVSHDLFGGPTENDNNRNWRGLENFVENLNWLPCENGPTDSLDSTPFGYDSNGTLVSWGPATSPLWRHDIMARTRMVMTQHNDITHGVAGFKALTGRRFGSPRAASLGSTIQRHYQSIQPGQVIPHSYVLAPGNIKPSWVSYATALGQHPGTARPLALKVGAGIGDLFKRNGISGDADAIVSNLRNQYRDLLRFKTAGNPVRSADFESYDVSSNYLVNSLALDNLLGGDTLKAGSLAPCAHTAGRGPYGLHKNPTHQSLETAALLLNNDARHVTVFDGGLVSDDTKAFLMDSSTPYDTHSGREDMDCVEMTSVHLFNVLQGLAAIIGNSNTQSLAIESSAGTTGNKISLDDTLILIHTEFNRTPNPVDSEKDGFNYAGREHYGQATAAIMIGGPIESRGIQGGVQLTNASATTADATKALTPTDIVAATMMAAGVDPIDPDNFLLSDDFSNEINPGGELGATEVRTRLKEKVFGMGASPGSTYSAG